MQTGAEQLREWMGRRFPKSERPQRDTAEYFGWDETFIHKLLHGHRLPGLLNATRIERMTGIPTEAWLSSELDESDTRAPQTVRKRA